MADASDAELVARSITGDEAAYAALARRHYRAAFAVALARTGHRSDAEDVCHDAFVRAAERLEECRHPDRFAHWLCTIVRNQAINHVARAFVRRTTELTPEHAAGRDDPARQIEITELREQLEHALAALTPVQREIVLLHDLEGWAHADIAKSVGTSEGMSRQHLFNARRRLRQALGANTSREYFNER
jgi:RNA polymerase sigma-70 factor (ECF subfamily)